MLVPFSQDSFQEDMKRMVSAVHLSLEYDNIESSIVKSCTELSEYIGEATYERICNDADGETGDKIPAAFDVQSKEVAIERVRDYLKRAILHYSVYQHIIYTIANISNDGITVTKSDDKTTIYKYQQDQLEEKLIADYWFWLNRLISYLEAYSEHFPEWKESEERKVIFEHPITLNDMQRFVGVKDETFFMYSGWVIAEVVREEVESRNINTAELEDNVKCAICYDVMGRAAQRLAYHCLPAPIRRDINNEMGKNHAQQADTTIRETVANIFLKKAENMWKAIDVRLQTLQEEDTATYPDARKITENQKFAV